MENSNEVFLRVTNHTGQAEKNLLGPAGIRTRDFQFTSPMLAQVPSFDDQLPTLPVAQLVEHRTSKPKVAGYFNK